MVNVVQFKTRGSHQVADFGDGVELIWTPAVDTGGILGIPALEAAPQAPQIWIYPPTEAADSIIVDPIYPPEFKDFILVFPPGSGIKPLYVVLSTQLEKNKRRGKEFEEEIFPEFSEEKADSVCEVTLKTDSGTRTRLDMIRRDADGKVSCVECKSSETAPLTKNQKKAFPEIEASGATVVGKGKPGFPGGTRIPPTRVDIVRPNPTP
ncbi:S-type pyocin domain-containing protein [Pseudomonas nunensis]|uniref:S-type pyocin domain-containing protein n=1 Tax=Pseudomonas nunensis TaxID=2961896 RepID=UPI0025AF583A|nr:S-type pyocin domain-containing protein [Pseudomonas nunensis]MDN3221358.1 S-type pyocin domain-containing protein [Pseudomonas nunensis]